MANMPITPQSNDPFGLKVLQAEEKLSYARSVFKKEAHPMTYSLGRAVGDLVGILRIPPKLFECGKTFRPLSPRTSSDSEIFTGVWSIYQDWKFYNAEGGTRRGLWSSNAAFRDGALQGYQARSGMLATLSNTVSAKEIIQIDDSSSDSESSDQEGRTLLEVKNWVQETQAAAQSLQHFDLDTRRWMIQEEDLSEDFLAELKDMADAVNVNSPGIDGDEMIDNMVANGDEMDIDTVIEGGLSVPSSDSPKDLENIHQLCKDLLGMHGEANSSRLAAKELEYDFSWTGM